MTERSCLRADKVCEIYGFSKPTLYRLIKAGKFPQGIKISAGVRVWIASEIDLFLDELSNEVGRIHG